jgi:hypothetical protein
MPPRIAVRDISFFERQVPFTKPFRFGAVVINAAAQAFVRVEIEVEGKSTSVGASAELMAPKWFDKRSQLTPEQTVGELRRSLGIARELYLTGADFDTAFGLHASRMSAQVEACAKEDIPPLADAYGPAEIDKAILDALLHGLGVNFFDGMAGNIAGIDARLSPDLSDDDLAQFLARCRRLPRVAIRHTVGLDDQVEGGKVASPISGKIAVLLFQAQAQWQSRCRYARLIRIERNSPRCHILQRHAGRQRAICRSHRARALVDWLGGDNALKPIAAKLLCIEQPMPRDIFRQRRSARSLPSISSSTKPTTPTWHLRWRARSAIAAFPPNPARDLKSVVNATRAAKWSASGEKFFITGEDLTCQAGLAAAGLALGALIGVTHAERNGHHYVNGFDTPAAEAQAFLPLIPISMS